MQLVKATIEGYRSIKEAVDLHLDPRVTVVLGANDHGKTNLLAALLHLNPENGFDEEGDLNWDCQGSRDSLPSVRYEIELSNDELSELRDLDRMSRDEASLVEFLEHAQGEAGEAEETAGNQRAEAEGLAEAVTEAEAVLDQAESAKEAAPEDATVKEALEAARSDLTSRRRNAKGASDAADEAESVLETALRRVAVANGRITEVRAALGGEPIETAVSRAVEAAEKNADAASDAKARAEDKANEASEAFESGKATNPEGTPEYEQLRKAAASTESTRKAAARRAAAARTALASAQRASEAIAGRQSGAPEWQIDLPTASQLPAGELPSTVVLQRAGIDGELGIVGHEDGGTVDAFVRERLPRVELIRPVDKIPDWVNREQLQQDDAVFMRGIFHYAELAPEEWDGIFRQDDATVRRLADASEALNTTIRESWSQGSKLTFRLDHNSRAKRIELRIQDPAVQQQYVRASKRSSGFTHFFAVKTILYAHQKEAPASSYLWVFDEPGVYLHPDGQHDLVQVMETLAQANQIVYSTHSIFMANKNYPARHRLIVKTVNGSKIEGKPFRGRWRPAIEALGMSMPGTVLFASRVLLVEGDSDSILINAMLQKLIELGEFDRDVNSLGVMAAGDAPDAAALVRILSESTAGPEIAALFDGDDGGQRRKRALERLEGREVEIKLLSPRGTTTEDHLPDALELYPKALANYLAKMSPRKARSEGSLTAEEFLSEITARRGELHQSKEGLTEGMAEWARKIGQEIGQLEEKPSSVGVAREYALLLQAAEASELHKGQRLRRARELGKWITAALNLPALTLSEEGILEQEEALEKDELA